MAIEVKGTGQDIPNSGGSETPRPGGASLDSPAKPSLPRGGYGEVMKHVYLGPPGGKPVENVIVTLTDAPKLPLIDPKVPYVRQSVLTRDYERGLHGVDGGAQHNERPDTTTVPPDISAADQEAIWKKYTADGKTGIVTLIGKRSTRRAYAANKYTLDAMAAGEIPVPKDHELAKVVAKYKLSKADGREAFEKYYTKIVS